MGLFDFLGKMFFPHLSLGFGGDDDGGGGGSQGGYEVVTMPQYDFTEPRLRLISDFLSQQIGGLQQGQIPPWIKSMFVGEGGDLGKYGAGSIGAGLERQLQNTQFGLPGQRYGVIPSLLSTAAITGAGGATANRMVERASQNYSEQAKRIDEFISEQMYTGAQDTLGKSLAYGTGMPKGPDSQIVQYGGYPSQSMDPYYYQAAQGAAGGGMSGIGDFFSNGLNALSGMMFKQAPTSMNPQSSVPYQGTVGYGYNTGGYNAAGQPMQYANSGQISQYKPPAQYEY